uniref:UBN2 domain-containing protein n=1 Tax=Manihot esculenta TaxID=3983 RepID=A0A2C9V3K6_MANES
MKSGETIAAMSTRFTDLINLLKAIEKGFEEAELVKKILRFLPKSWEAKTTIIFDTKDYTKYTYNELIRSLIAYKMMFKKEIIEKEKCKKIHTSESSDISSNEEEIAILARKFRRAFRKCENKYKKFVKKYGPKDDSQSHLHKNPKEVICYEYNKPNHIRFNCLKSKKKKKKR